MRRRSGGMQPHSTFRVSRWPTGGWRGRSRSLPTSGLLAQKYCSTADPMTYPMNTEAFTGNLHIRFGRIPSPHCTASPTSAKEHRSGECAFRTERQSQLQRSSLSGRSFAVHALLRDDAQETRPILTECRKVRQQWITWLTRRGRVIARRAREEVCRRARRPHVDCDL